ncbi:MAG: hypothetical protein WCO06_07100, partial [Candidatus Roizmanbacteria bacterium]
MNESSVGSNEKNPLIERDQTLFNITKLEQTGRAFRGVQNYLLRQSPQKIGTWGEIQTFFAMAQLPQDLKSYIEAPFVAEMESYVKREQAINAWWEKNNLDNPKGQDQTVINEVLKWVNRGDSFTVEEKKPTIVRAHDAIAIKMSLSDWQRLVKAKTENNGQTQETVTGWGLGCTLTDKELESAGLPPELNGMKIIVVVDDVFAQDVIEHEEREVLGVTMDTAIVKQSHLQEYTERNNPIRDANVLRAYHDMIARVELNGTFDFGNIGISHGWIESNPQLAKTVADLYNLIQAKVSTFSHETQERQDELRLQLANILRAGIIDPERMVSTLRAEFPTFDSSGPLTLLGDNPVITSERDVRFTYIAPSLNPGDLIVNLNAQQKGKVIQLISQGGQGATYLVELLQQQGAFPTTQPVRLVVKQLIMPEGTDDLPSALITHGTIAQGVVDDMIKEIASRNGTQTTRLGSTT